VVGAPAVPSTKARQHRALLKALLGIVIVGTAAASFRYLDVAAGPETMGGTVTNTWRERGGYVYCQVRLSDGVAINDMCDSLPIGTQVLVDRYQKRLSRRYVYSPPRVAK